MTDKKLTLVFCSVLVAVVRPYDDDHSGRCAIKFTHTHPRTHRHRHTHVRIQDWSTQTHTHTHRLRHS